jgi:surfeit locus 1 family protein
MKPRIVLTLLAGLCLATVCARLGVWQIARLQQKRAANASLRAAMLAPPVEIGAVAPPFGAVRHRRVHARGHYDETRQLLLTGLLHLDQPGVHVLTPLVLDGGGTVMVDRGWLNAPDAMSARPRDFAEAGNREVLGVAESIAAGVAGTPWRPLAGDSLGGWTTHRLALDSLRARMPFAVAAYTVRQLPSPELPAQPVREAPEPLDEGMHLSYAVQWFLFAAAAMAGAVFLAFRPAKPA